MIGTATKNLRIMLDIAGIRWWQKRGHTCWKVTKGCEVEMWRAWEAPDGSLTLKVDAIYGLTPLQAISASFGAARKTHTVEHCDNCDGAVLPIWNKCPWCGTQLMEVTA